MYIVVYHCSVRWVELDAGADEIEYEQYDALQFIVSVNISCHK